MKNLKFTTVSSRKQNPIGIYFLVIILASAVAATTDLAAKGKPTQPGGGFSAEFCLDTNDVLAYAFTSDGADYCHSKSERVSVLAGDTGFNFQSFTRNRGTPIRDVWVEFPGGSVVAKHDFNGEETVFTSGFYTMTMRFDKDDGGLAWADIGVGEQGTVPMSIWLQNAAGDDIGMAHGPDVDPLTSGELAGNTCVLQTGNAVVTNVNGTEWTIESNPGNPVMCLWDRGMSFADQTGVPVSMPYRFSLTVK